MGVYPRFTADQLVPTITVVACKRKADEHDAIVDLSYSLTKYPAPPLANSKTLVFICSTQFHNLDYKELTEHCIYSHFRKHEL